MIDQITAAAEKANNEDLPSVGRMCDLLGVSRSGWYAHRAHQPGQRGARRVDLAVKPGTEAFLSP